MTYLLRAYPLLLFDFKTTDSGEPLVPCVWEGAPLASNKLPVIVFSHGFGGTRFVSATVAAELASFGFLIASIEHR